MESIRIYGLYDGKLIVTYAVDSTVHERTRYWLGRYLNVSGSQYFFSGVGDSKGPILVSQDPRQAVKRAAEGKYTIFLAWNVRPEEIPHADSFITVLSTENMEIDEVRAAIVAIVSPLVQIQSHRSACLAA
jgi:hypothetical protein